MSIEVFNESGYDGVNEEMLIDVLSFALGEMDIHPDAEASIHIVDVDTIADLHVKWLDLEGPTDVMSFPMDELTPATPAPTAPPRPRHAGRHCAVPRVRGKASDQSRPRLSPRASFADRARQPAPAWLRPRRSSRRA